MSTDRVATASASKTEATIDSGSTVCEVCAGIGNEDHPRSKTYSPFADYPKTSCYIYLHYPDPKLLQSSFERFACRMCRLILSCIQYDSLAGMNPHDEHARDERDKLARFNIVQDTCEAASLVGFAEIHLRPGHRTCDLKIEGCGYGRVALHILSCSSPRTIAEPHEMMVHVFETVPMAPALSRTSWLFCSAVDPIDENYVHRPATDLLSDTYIGLVRRWMMTCEAGHQTCLQHSRSVHKLPTRLLKIERRHGEIIGVRLIDTTGGETPYVCLSYCWGSNSQQLMTTTANLNEYRHSIPWRKLPSTISDAIELCHRLGFEYLWVDSLCIVQDSQQDWLQEASNMAGVYSGSSLTLAIHLCEDASESFLQKRLLDTEQWSDGPNGCARIPFTDSNTGKKMDMFFWVDDHFKGSRFLDSWWLSIRTIGKVWPSGKWLSRAWTFQEWFLSPRVLHVHAMTVWDCFDSRGNELEDRFLSRRAFPRAVPRDWLVMLSDFTSRHITMEKDRLPALAGLVERYQARTRYTYLAGLWLEELPKTLIWTASKAPMRQPLTYRAPTWSWAALEGEIFSPTMDVHPQNRYEDCSCTSDVVRHHCQYNPPGSFATVIDGWLEIEGPMNVVSGWTINVEDTWRGRTRIFTHDQHEDVQSPQYWIATLDQNFNIKEETRRGEIHLLEVVAGKLNGNEVVLRTYALVLMLADRSRTGQDCFQRLGVAYMDSLSPSISTMESWTKRIIRLI